MPHMTRLSRRQRALRREIEEIVDLLRLDFRDLSEIESRWRTPYLERIKDHLIRSAVVLDYARIDIYLDSVICPYFFDVSRGYIRLWRTSKKFRNFNYFILEKLYVSQKLDLAKAIYRGIPKDIENAIRKINDLRNGLAHSFFPENRRVRLPLFEGKSIYSTDGFKRYLNEMRNVTNYFRERIG
jgi:hypothetical protein